MKVKNLKFRYVLGLIFCISLLFPGAVAVMASTDTFDVTLKCATSDGKTLMSGETFSVYQVADENQNTIDAFASVNQTKDETAYAEALEAYVKKYGDMTPVCTLTVASDGTASFQVSRGTYLVCGKSIKKGNITYTPVPYILKLTGDDYKTLTSYVKYTSDEPKPSTPEDKTTTTKTKVTTDTTVRTGDQSMKGLWIYLAAMVLSLMIIGVVLRRGRKKRKKKD